ncbi:MAG: phage minor head protein [Aliarcobacter sp.]
MAASFNVQMSEKMTRHLIEMYAKGAVAAVQEGDLQPGIVELGAADKAKLAERVARLTAPMADYNIALSNKVYDLVIGMVDEDKSPGEIANALRIKIPEFLSNEPISIQRPGKSKFTATPRQYAEMIARIVPNDIRNEGYIQKAQEMGVADGWIWDGILDGSTCKRCREEIQDRRVRSWDEPRPPQASHPNCRCRPVAHIDAGKKEALKKRVAELKARAEAEAAAGPGPGMVSSPRVQPLTQTGLPNLKKNPGLM